MERDQRVCIKPKLLVIGKNHSDQYTGQKAGVLWARAREVITAYLHNKNDASRSVLSPHRVPLCQRLGVYFNNEKLPGRLFLVLWISGCCFFVLLMGVTINRLASEGGIDKRTRAWTLRRHGS